MRKTTGTALAALLLSGSIAVASAAGSSGSARYLVLARSGADAREVRAALAELSERVVVANPEVGLSTVVAGPGFVKRAMGTGLFFGVSRDRAIGRRPQELDEIGVRHPTDRGITATKRAVVVAQEGADPLYKHQWGLQQIDAGPSTSYAIEKGDPGVLVGILDSGISAAHPDIGPNFNVDLSRNFTRDIPAIDGPCRAEKDGSCEDPVSVDEGGHGTWVATTVAGAVNGRGISGVAPDVTLVNLRVGQDSVYVFLQPVVDALTYAGDIGVDVANMSFFIDPWLYNCPDNDADSDAAQMEQRTIVEATQRAVDYARERDVTLVSAIGNEFSDLSYPEKDTISPDYPPGSEYPRDVDNSCLQMPTEAEGVIAVSATGPSGRKSWFSNYGLEQTDVAAPGGDTFDDALPFPFNGALAGWTKISLWEFGLLKKDGSPASPDVIRRCRRTDTGKKRCAYYVFFEGTSIASPVATGVAALIVSAFGEPDPDGGLTMDPDLVQKVLETSAVPHDCPDGGVQDYPEVAEALGAFGITAEDLRAVCEEGPADTNGFYGHGIVNATNALQLGQGAGPP